MQIPDLKTVTKGSMVNNFNIQNLNLKKKLIQHLLFFNFCLRYKRDLNLQFFTEEFSFLNIRGINIFKLTLRYILFYFGDLNDTCFFLMLINTVHVVIQGRKNSVTWVPLSQYTPVTTDFGEDTSIMDKKRN